MVPRDPSVRPFGKEGSNGLKVRVMPDAASGMRLWVARYCAHSVTVDYIGFCTAWSDPLLFGDVDSGSPAP